MLSIGLKLQHHCLNGLLPLLVAALTMPQAETRTTFLFRMEPHRGTLALQKLLLGRGQLRDLESEVGGSAPKRVDLTLSMSRFIKLGTSIDELHPIPEHSIHEPSQFCCHSLDRYRRP
jgi:hypothetical protein